MLKCECVKSIVRISHQLAPCPQWLSKYLIHSAYQHQALILDHRDYEECSFQLLTCCVLLMANRENWYVNFFHPQQGRWLFPLARTFLSWKCMQNKLLQNTKHYFQFYFKTNKCSEFCCESKAKNHFTYVLWVYYSSINICGEFELILLAFVWYK